MSHCGFPCFFPWLLFPGTSLPKRSLIKAEWVNAAWSVQPVILKVLVCVLYTDVFKMSKIEASWWSSGYGLFFVPLQGEQVWPLVGEVLQAALYGQKKKKTQSVLYVTTYLWKAKVLKTWYCLLFFLECQIIFSLLEQRGTEWKLKIWYRHVGLMWLQVDLCLVYIPRHPMQLYYLSTCMYKWRYDAYLN